MRSFVRGCMGLVVVVAIGCSKSDDKQSAAPTDTVETSLEDACVQIVTATCTTLASCCHAGTTFDAFECKRDRLAQCLSGAAGVHEGNVRFNAAAMQACPYTALASCAVQGSSATSLTPQQEVACRTVMTGYRPLGSGCTSDADCAIPDVGYPECVHAQPDDGQGVCAKHVISPDGTCGFYADTYESRGCAQGQYCELTGSTTPQYEGKASFERHGTCHSYALEGDACAQTNQPSSVGCAPGLVCTYTGGGSTTPRCAKPHQLGDACGTDTIPCDTGLSCGPTTHVCEVATATIGQYCYVEQPTGAGGSSGSSCATAQACCQKLGNPSCSSLTDATTCDTYLQAYGSACGSPGTGGSGTGGSTNAYCQPPVGSPGSACATCVEQSCSSQALEALGSSWTQGVYGGACGPYLSCVCGCAGDSTCVQGCSSSLGQCSTAAQQLQSCEQQSCPGKC